MKKRPAMWRMRSSPARVRASSASRSRRKAHRVAEPVDLAAPLAGRHHALRTGEAHRDRDLDQRVLASLEAADRLRLVLLAGRGQHDHVDRRVRQRLVERQGPSAIAEARGELPGRLGPAADHRVQHGAGIDAGPGNASPPSCRSRPCRRSRRHRVAAPAPAPSSTEPETWSSRSDGSRHRISSNSVTAWMSVPIETLVTRSRMNSSTTGT